MRKQLRVFKKAAQSDLPAICLEINDFIEGPAVMLLSGPVGAGKTTFTQAFLQVMNHGESTSSPTYSLVYELGEIVHADLYRVQDSEELIHLELPLVLEGKKMAFIEWARPHWEFLRRDLPDNFFVYEVEFETIPEQQELRHLTFYSLEES